MALKCPVCLAGNRPNDHPKHTKIEGECRNAPLGANGRRGRRSGLIIREYTPETPAPVAHHDRTGIIPPTAPASDAPEAEPAPAERVVEETPSTGSASASGATAAAGGARLPAPDARPPRPSSTNRAAQAPRATGNRVRETGTHTEEQEWTAFDVGHAVKMLHSATPEIVRRTLRRLHVRFYHAPAQRMKDLLAHAGAPKSALEMIKSVVETCRVCRLWTRPSARGMTITRLANGFREIVQWDILFIEDIMISHCIDEATRWSAGGILENKDAMSLCRSLLWNWIKPYGPMKLLVTDSESSIFSEELGTFLSRHGIQAKPKATGAHANIVERHHEIFRQFVQRVQAQLREESIKMPLDFIVAECFIVKNMLISVAGYTPYQAVFGRMPPEFEPKSECQLDDASAGIPGVSRFHHRLREIAVQSMIELTAQQRLNRALKSHTRRPLEALQLQVGDEVDFYRPPATKEESGWRGPATVVEIGPPVVIKWQDRRLAYRTQDIRRALVYLAFLTSNLANVHVIVEGDNATYLVQSDDPSTIVQSFTDGLQRRMIRIG